MPEDWMSTDLFKRFDPARWSACTELLLRPIESLDPIQRAAALVLLYDGHVQNGGHTSHFDSQLAEHDDELLKALKDMGAHKHAMILTEARFLKRSAEQATDDESDYYWESIEDLDRGYYRVRPDISDVLADYFDANREHFPR